ncbi:MAG: site-2 protease family protein [Alphaproteobacteria bacterium]|nr:site-2 protease family protein [Alphaproteobacteria bacterium]
MILETFLIFLSLLLAIILHEVAHGYVAYLLGDTTAKIQGRLSLNPLKHIDMVGTIILPLFLWLSRVPFMFGWAKPVPINPQNLKKFPRDEILVASAGIIMNLGLALLASLVLHLSSLIIDSDFRVVLRLFLFYFMTINIGLAVFNAIPIPPLDGSKVLFGWIDRPWAKSYLYSYKYGLIIMIVLLLILPMIGNNLGLDLNIIGHYIASATQYICSFLI